MINSQTRVVVPWTLKLQYILYTKINSTFLLNDDKKMMNDTHSGLLSLFICLDSIPAELVNILQKWEIIETYMMVMGTWESRNIGQVKLSGQSQNCSRMIFC